MIEFSLHYYWQIALLTICWMFGERITNPPTVGDRRVTHGIFLGTYFFLLGAAWPVTWAVMLIATVVLFFLNRRDAAR